MKNERIVLVDALRGFALFLIILIHYVEHLELFKDPEVHFLFSDDLDKTVMEQTFFYISGKAYSIFALLFGLSFFIQMDNKGQQGIDYRKGFAWRMLVLLAIGFIHSLIYRGDILHIYALLSFPVILLFNVKSKYLWVITILLVLQVPMLYNLVLSFMDSDYVNTPLLKDYFNEGNGIYASGSFWEVVRYNVWKGRVSAWSWTVNNGRYLQLLALFVVGLILGRKQAFRHIEGNKKGLYLVLLGSLIGYFVLSYLNNKFQSSVFTAIQKELINTLLTSLINLAITCMVVAIFSLVYLQFKNGYVFRLFAAYGKLSLTNYVSQAVFGVIFFYGFGFAMYKYLGSTWSIILGAVIFVIQAIFSMYWNKKYYYGPLEWFWRCTTNLDFGVRFRRDS